jgi:hypothetical protein
MSSVIILKGIPFPRAVDPPRSLFELGCKRDSTGDPEKEVAVLDSENSILGCGSEGCQRFFAAVNPLGIFMIANGPISRCFSAKLGRYSKQK